MDTLPGLRRFNLRAVVTCGTFQSSEWVDAMSHHTSLGAAARSLASMRQRMAVSRAFIYDIHTGEVWSQEDAAKGRTGADKLASPCADGVRLANAYRNERGW